jgi:hypothetical protein
MKIPNMIFSLFNGSCLPFINFFDGINILVIIFDVIQIMGESDFLHDSQILEIDFEFVKNIGQFLKNIACHFRSLPQANAFIKSQ